MLSSTWYLCLNVREDSGGLLLRVQQIVAVTSSNLALDFFLSVFVLCSNYTSFLPKNPVFIINSYDPYYMYLVVYNNIHDFTRHFLSVPST